MEVPIGQCQKPAPPLDEEPTIFCPNQCFQLYLKDIFSILKLISALYCNRFQEKVCEILSDDLIVSQWWLSSPYQVSVNRSLLRQGAL